MVRIMKRIVSFIILSVTFAVIMTMPAVEVPAASHPIPVWSILLYLGVVLIAVVAVVLMRQKKIEPAIA